MDQPRPSVIIRSASASPTSMFRSSASSASPMGSSFELDHHPPTPMTACCPQPNGPLIHNNSLSGSEVEDEHEGGSSSGASAMQEESATMASALVGETVCDSPTASKPRHSLSKAEMESNAPFPMSDDASKADSTSSSLSRRSSNDAAFLGTVRSHKPQAPRAPVAKNIRSDSTISDSSGGSLMRRSSSGDDSTDGGLVASGLAWVQRQRERRRRQYLKSQAEKQIRKIVEAETQPARQDLSESEKFRQMNLSNSGSSRSLDFSEDVVDGHKSKSTAASQLKAELELSKTGEGVVGDLGMLAGNQEDDAMLWTPKVRIEPEARRKQSDDDDDDDEDEEEAGPVFILTLDQMQEIAAYVLPITISSCRWKRLYSLARDGDSFKACMRAVERYARSLIVVRTTRGAVFGGYADASWISHEAGNFYGSAQACLFTFSSKVSSHPGRQIRVFKWTGANRYIQLCDTSSKMLAFGGGGDVGAFGLSVQDDFQTGSTGPCDTFGNEPLCDQEHFDIVDVEIWGFLTGVF